ncbi:MAG: hypothetical protein GXP59_06010 [Deltaproteobacteria bacterium]|nr:hypothetical protein [Deltaproteobacteria bacterium]
MEKRLGCRLFDRLGRSIKPTSKADILYPKALSIIDDIKKAKEELSAEDQRVSGELIVGASTIPGAYILPHLATVFKSLHPATSFEIRIADSSEIIDDVLNYDVLIGIVGTKTASKNLKFSPFVEDQLVLAAPISREAASVSLKTLVKLPFLSREKGSGTRTSMEKFWLKNGCKGQLNTVAVFGSNAAIKEAIKANLGVSILSRISISDDLECGKIKEIKIKGITMKRSFYIVTRKNRTLPNNYKVFLSSLLESAHAIVPGK